MAHAPTEAAIAARLEAMPRSGWHARLLAIVGAASLSDAYDATAIAYVLPVLVGLWRLSPVQTGLLISAGYVGQLAGALAAGAIAERHGRIATLRLSLLVLSLLSLACAFAPNYAVLLGLRLAQGLGLGAEPPLAATYLSEVLPARLRGRMVSGLAVVFGTGAMLAAVIGVVLIPRFGWQSMFVVGTLPIVLAVLLPRLLPESPRWLAARGHGAKAQAAIARIERAVFHRREPAAPGIPADPVGMAHQRPGTPPADLRALLAPDLRRATLSGWLITFATSTIAYGIIAWMPTIYRTIYHLPVAVALRYGAIAGLVGIGGAVASTLVIDRIGRRPTIAAGFALACLCMLALARWSLVLDPVQVMALIAAAYMALGLPLAAQYVYLPELYPTAIRAFGVGLATSWMRVASIVTPPVIGGLLGWGSVRLVYLLFAGAAAMGLAGILLLGGRPGALPLALPRTPPGRRSRSAPHTPPRRPETPPACR